MTVRTVSVAPEYVSFYVVGSRSFEVPLAEAGVGIVADEYCINVGCLYWGDGNTTITLGPFDEIDRPERLPKFDGSIETPESRVLLTDVNIPEILSMSVAETRTRVRRGGPSKSDQGLGWIA